MAAAKSKHVSFPNQREQCRLNKFTYTEKCSCGIVTLMCNYPFKEPEHKKGVCRASTCTDMRKTLARDIDEIAGADTEAITDEPVKKLGSSLGDDVTEEGAGIVSGIVGSHVPVDTVKGEGYAADGTLKDPEGAVRAE